MIITTIYRNTAEYPQRFGRLSDPPLSLRIAGTLPDAPYVGIVGSRKADARLARWTEQLAGALTQRGICVVSGGAAGIDTAAHRGALARGGRTVAVIGSGFDHLYPPENRSLFEEISRSGAVVTEFDDRVPPAKWTFPKRNRLVAALCSALVVVQASTRSGALITARLARAFGVPVGAVPAIPGDERSRGCHLLIQGGARLIDNVEDVASMLSDDRFRVQLNLHGTAIKDKESSGLPPETISGDELVVWQQLGTEPLHIDEIAAVTGFSPQRIATAMLQLELSSHVVDSGGRCFARSP